ncbi:inositol monophosphatase family protein [Psychromicrobium xiongbiense]|uniref:inositol monophosphatase family protein n=1 Tax=Psychromicrobium xiongbiense TaxID=3051184 RepID=UPI00255370C6|nr:inositol monophosphatase [Psychromicrobium sp. YIM S02556]
MRPTELATTPEISRARQTALELAAWAVAETRSYRPSGVTTKANPADLVTELDTRIERQVRAVIGDRFPDHGFVGEEYGGEASPGRPTWYLDPVDGTTNLANGVPWTAFSLALAVDRTPLIGVIADPWREQIFDAAAGAGARCNGELLPSLTASTLTGSVVSTELAGHLPWPGMRGLEAALAERFCTVRVMGSGTLTLLGIAAGRGAGAVIGRFGAEDHLAATLIAQEAGAAVLNEAGQVSLFPASGGILVAAPAVAQELHALWRSALPTE